MKGAMQMKYPANLTGLRIKKFLVLGKDNERSGRMTYWLCQCECGTVKSVRRDHLISEGKDSTVSCGCHRRKNPSLLKSKDELGAVYGKLTVKSLSGSTPDGKLKWNCLCECGKEVIVDGRDLRQGQQSCGCIKASIGESNIAKVLDENGVKYQKEYVFDELTKVCGRRLRYDFALLDADDKVIKLIEFDGTQHYDKKNSMYSEDLVERDRIKNAWAAVKGIPLQRITYDYRDKITYEFIKAKDLYDEFKDR